MAFSAKTLDFLFENRLNNSKEWYDEHKAVYTEFVLEPLAELVMKMAPAITEIDGQLICEPKVTKCISRIRRDTRFTHDKSLYRDVMWVVFMRDKRAFPGYPAFFIEISPRGLNYGCGYYEAGSDTMDAIRKLILKDDPAFRNALEAFANQNVFGIGGEMYRRSRYPDKDDSLRMWLDRKSIDFVCSSKDFELMFSDSLAQKCSEDFKRIKPIYEFLIRAHEIKAYEKGAGQLY